MAPKPPMARPKPSEPSVGHLEEALEINEHRLEDALLSQPDAFYRVAKALALETSRRDAAKQAVTEAEANSEINIRKMAAADDYKITVVEVEAKKQLMPSVKLAHEQLLDLNRRVATLSALKEAFTQRGYVLKSLVELHITNYYGSDIDTRAGNDMKMVSARRAKEALAQERDKFRSNRK